MEKSIGLVVLQPTRFCNISCRYCYLPDRGSRKKMSMETVNNIFTKIFQSGWAQDQFTVVWHAGEPMVMPIAFYDEAFASINQLKPKHITIKHSFQTNGTLISQEWCDFVQRTGLRLGISIDGPKLIHDKFRVTRDGKGTFDKVMQGIVLLKKNNIDFSVIAVVTYDSLKFPDKLYEFYKKNKIKIISVNIEEIEGNNKQSSLAEEKACELYRYFLYTLWRRMLQDRPAITLREFETTFASIVRPSGTAVTNSQVTPFSILNVDVDGNFSTFSPEFLGQTDERYGNFCFGNLNEVPLESALSNPIFLRLNEDIQAGVEKCKAECQYFSVCGGGAPVNKLNENGSLSTTATMFCRLTQMVPTDLALDLLENNVTLNLDSQTALDAEHR